MEEPNKLNELTGQFQDYLSTNHQLVKLETMEKISVIGASLVSTIIIGLTVLISLFFFSFWAGLVVSDLLGEKHLGFVLVGAFYFLLVLLMAVFRKKILEHPLREKILSKIVDPAPKKDTENFE